MNIPYRLGWFSTGRDRAARDLLTVVANSIKQGEIQAEIAFVFSNRKPGEGKESDLFFKLVEGYHIPLVCFSYQKYREARGEQSPGPSRSLPQWRLDYDREVMSRLAGFKPDLCVLAGYMLIAGKEMCQRYDMINLHPAAPGGPVGTWQEVIWQLIEARAGQTGVLMNLVTPELDRGPVVAYCTFSIRGEPFDRYWAEIEGHPIKDIRREQGESNALFLAIRKHGLAREFPLIVATIKAFSEGKIRINKDKKVIDANGRRVNGYDLTGEIEKKVKEVVPW